MNEPYDLVIIGAGSAGLTAVNYARQFGARVALVERDRIGGDCTWAGCVPSKALLHVARLVQSARQAARRGFTKQENELIVDMAQVRAYVQQAMMTIAGQESPQILREQGVDLFFGEARFRDAFNLEVGERVIAGKKFLLATGARPVMPAVSGLAETPFVTYQQIFAVDHLPQHLVVLGAGPVGVELAQAYGRLGARVTVIDESILPKEDEEAGRLMARILQGEGVAFMPGLAAAAEYRENRFFLTINGSEGQKKVSGGLLLVAVGRQPNVAGLGLEEAGVAYGRHGIQVNDRLATTAGHIFAAGDCLGGYQFTHYASWQAYKAVRNALLPGGSSGHTNLVPRTIFTDPEVAHVGLTAVEAQVRFGADVKVVRQDLARVDRATMDDAAEGFIKLVRHKDGRILGATIVAPRAGEMIAEIALAMQNNIKLAGMAFTIHPYPSYAIGIQTLVAEEVAQDFAQSRIGRFVRRLSG